MGRLTKSNFLSVMKKIIPVLVVLLWAFATMASTADDLSKNLNTLIRNAENQFFKGKINEAATMLAEIEAGLVQLKSADSGHRSLKTLQTKYDRLKERVKKKLGSSRPAAAVKAVAASVPAPSASAAKNLSSGAKSNLKRAGSEMDFAEKEFVKGEKSLQEKKFNLVESYIFNATSKLDNAKNLLERVVNNNKADPHHPDVASAFQRHNALLDKLTAFSTKAQEKKAGVEQEVAQANKDDARINQTWLPQIAPYTDHTSNSRLQYPGSFNEQELGRQETLYGKAKKLLGDVEKQIPEGQQPHDLKRSIEKLRFALQVFEDEKKADGRNRLQPVENTLSDWERRFEQNKNWNETSGLGLFIITTKKLEYQKKQVSELSKVFSKRADDFSQRLKKLEKENKAWVEKKRRWQERPRPFPQANMKSNKLEKEMVQLLKDRDIQVKDIVIVDKDWWVQAGEFRYVTTAVLSKDKKGTYWSNVSFRQMQTLTGYGPTEIWDIDEIRIRLP